MRFVTLILGALLQFIIYSQPRDNNDDLIIGGSVAYIEEFPFIVSMQSRGRHICGGSLLSSTKVLTACHCVVVKNRDPKHPLRVKKAYLFSLLAGTVKVSGKSGTRRSAKTILKHPECIKLETGWTYDFAMITAVAEFPLIHEQIEIIPLPIFENLSLEAMSESEAECGGAGWGSTYEDANATSPVLMKVDLKLISAKECSKRMTATVQSMATDLMFRNSTQMCTLGEDEKDACQGDSGGPLLCKDGSGKKIFCAIVSWGIGCGRFGVPGVWARLDIAEPWIRARMTDSNDDRDVNADTADGTTEMAHAKTSGLQVNNLAFLTSIASLISTIKLLHSPLLSCF